MELLVAAIAWPYFLVIGVRQFHRLVRTELERQRKNPDNQDGT